jgi:hypothetical protein
MRSEQIACCARQAAEAVRRRSVVGEFLHDQDLCVAWLGLAELSAACKREEPCRLRLKVDLHYVNFIASTLFTPTLHSTQTRQYGTAQEGQFLFKRQEIQ